MGSTIPVSLQGLTVKLEPPEGQLKAYAKSAQDRVRTANSRYRQFVLPEIARKQAERERCDKDDALVRSVPVGRPRTSIWTRMRTEGERKPVSQMR